MYIISVSGKKNRIRSKLNLTYHEPHRTIEGNTQYAKVLFHNQQAIDTYAFQDIKHFPPMGNKNSKEERTTPIAKRTRIIESQPMPQVSKQNINQCLINPNGRSHNLTVSSQGNSTEYSTKYTGNAKFHCLK